MDDSCAVCADNLEWVAYGACGHREVCSTCVVRLRFICDDRRCCICKSESDVVFVTKAMGDYTKMIGDFSTLPSQRREGKVGPYWYHEDTQAYFDDADHYNMIKATCRLSCNVCDKAAAADESADAFKKRQRFRNISQLKGHLAHQHKLFMCDLCLEGRKVFICEQKLYTRTQLNQHRRTGDSVVDGTETDRGGFDGHPNCEFCRTSFYGENELYTHMSREHFTCHICQRQHPEAYEYYKDYDDLETHFRHGHHLCEDEECLRKKFIVFQTAEDLKRHNAMEHGGRMSRSKRNAVLQIPTSFRYRSNNESGYHRGRRRSFRRESSPESELADQDILDRVSSSFGLPDPSTSTVSTDPSLVQSFESLNTSESESSRRYRQAVSQVSATGTLIESSFPPLPTAPSSSQQKSQAKSKNTMASRLRRQNKATVLNVAQPRTASSGLWPAPPMPAPRPAAPTPAPRPAAPTPAPRPAAPTQAPRPAAPTPAPRPTAPTPTARSSVPTPTPTPTPATRPSISTPASTSSPWPSLAPSPASVQMKVASANGFDSSSYASSLRSVDDPGHAMGGSWAARNQRGSSKLNHSNSAPNLVESRSFDSVTDFPPVSAAQHNMLHSSGRNKTEDVQTANKTLVERMRTALEYDEDKYNVFKGISQEYRQGSIGTWEYLEYVKQFDLTHLVPDLAKLLPDMRKQKELLEAYSATTQSNGSRETFWDDGNIHMKGSSSSKDKGKKVLEPKSSRSHESLADSVISTVRSLQSQMKPSEEVEVLGKDGYRVSRGKSTMGIGDNPLEYHVNDQQSTVNKNGNGLVDGGGAKNQKKKTSKFHRLRLGDNSPAATLNFGNSSTDAPSDEIGATSSKGVSNRSVWSGKAGQRLFSK